MMLIKAFPRCRGHWLLTLNPKVWSSFGWQTTWNPWILRSCQNHTTSDARLQNVATTQLSIHARDIFDTAVCSVLPQNMIKNALKVEDEHLIVGKQQFPLDRNVYVLGFGKAVIGMVKEVEDLLGNHIVQGVANVPHGIQESLRLHGKNALLPSPNGPVKIIEGAKNNIPDEAANAGAIEIYNLAKSLGKKDIALTLISGGGSALLPAPIKPITLQEMAVLTRALSTSGATIQQLNIVRKNLELLKGGGLAKVASPAKVVSLILSDIIGDPLDLIASGPTVKDNSTPQQCLDLFRMLKIDAQVPASVRTFLQSQSTRHNSFDCSNTINVLIGSNRIAIQNAFEKAKSLNYLPYILSTTLDGDARDAGVLLSKLAHFICQSISHKQLSNKSLAAQELGLIRRGVCKDSIKSILRLANSACNSDRPICILAAGETTVSVRGRGKGGRNQELALSCALHMADTIAADGTVDEFDIEVLSGGTDGQDGPTDVTGAHVTPRAVIDAHAIGEDGLLYLLNNDSYTFFSRFNDGSNWVKTGLTGTNVMDIQILLIRRKSK